MSEHALVVASRRIGVTDQRVLNAVGQVDRAGFVPPGVEQDADIDAPASIAHGQVTTQPSLVAAMIEALELSSGARVLEVGTGLGYQAAVLAHVAGDVVTVERFPDLADAARANLDAAGIRNVTVVVGDGSLGAPEHAPFDAVVVAAAFPEVPPPLVEQLVVGGRLVMPVGPGGSEDVVAFRRGASGLERIRSVIPARFVRLHGAHGYPLPREL